jgi:hypothetical protein
MTAAFAAGMLSCRSVSLLGMVEEEIASEANFFIGTSFSSITGIIAQVCLGGCGEQLGCAGRWRGAAIWKHGYVSRHIGSRCWLRL